MIAMDVHPLRQAYIKAVRKQYGKYVGGDKDPCKTEQAAMKICKLGLDYAAYMDVALRLFDKFAKRKGWDYPYWSVIISPKTIARVAKMLNYTTDLDDDEETDLSGMFEAELGWATDYIEWWFGRGPKPRREDCSDVPQTVKSQVAEYLCRLHGLANTSSNYNTICEALEKQHARQ